MQSSSFRTFFTCKPLNLLTTSIQITNTEILNYFTEPKETDFQIILDSKKMNQLNNNLPKSGFKYKKGHLVWQNDTLEAKFRYRGDLWNHWGYPRKSWRVKLKNKNHIFKTFNLIVPETKEMFNNHYSYLLAKKLGLKVPESKMVNLSLNNKYDGIRLFVEQLDQHFLDKHNLNKSTIYKGDYVSNNINYGDKFSDIFLNAIYWENKSKNNHDSILSKMIEEVNQLNFSKLDMEKFARLSVALSLANSHHVDNMHNWVLLFNENTQKFEPLAWDFSGWRYNYPANRDILVSKIFLLLYTDFNFIKLKQEILKNFIEEDLKDFISILDNENSELKQLMKLNNYHFPINQAEINGFMNSDQQQVALEAGYKKVIKNFNNVVNLSRFNNAYFQIMNSKEILISLNSLDVIKKLNFNFKNQLHSLDSMKISYYLNGTLVNKKFKLSKNSNDNYSVNVNLISDYEISKPFLGEKQHINPISSTFILTFENEVKLESVKLRTIFDKKYDFKQSSDSITRTTFINRSNIL